MHSRTMLGQLASVLGELLGLTAPLLVVAAAFDLSHTAGPGGVGMAATVAAWSLVPLLLSATTLNRYCQEARFAPPAAALTGVWLLWTSGGAPLPAVGAVAGCAVAAALWRATPAGSVGARNACRLRLQLQLLAVLQPGVATLCLCAYMAVRHLAACCVAPLATAAAGGSAAGALGFAVACWLLLLCQPPQPHMQPHTPPPPPLPTGGRRQTPIQRRVYAYGRP